MTDQPTNPFHGRRTDPPAGIRFEPGTDAARQQLQDHCDRLNHMKGDRYWFVIKRDDKLTIDNGPRQTSAASPPASPEEVRRIMQQHGFR